MVDFMIDFIAEFIASLIEWLATPWVDKMNKKWKRRKKEVDFHDQAYTVKINHNAKGKPKHSFGFPFSMRIGRKARLSRAKGESL